MSEELCHVYVSGHLAAIVDRERLEGEVKQLKAELAAAQADTERLKEALRAAAACLTPGTGQDDRFAAWNAVREALGTAPWMEHGKS